MFYYGNKSLLQLPKTAFFCSRSIPAEEILRTYDWAREQRKQGTCIISGFHSIIEKDMEERKKLMILDKCYMLKN